MSQGQQQRVALALAALGLLLTLAVVWQVGWRDIFRLFLDFGLQGTLITVALHLLPVAATTQAWWVILQKVPWRADWAMLFWARLVGDYVNALLPVAQIGGELARGLLLQERLPDRAWVASSILVDLTCGLLSLVLFVLLGLSLLLSVGGLRAEDGWALAIALITAFGLLGGFYVLQRHGARWLIRLSGQLFGKDAHALGEAWANCERILAAIYADRRLLFEVTAWRLAAWFGGAIEIGFALWCLDAWPGWAGVLVLEAVAQVFRNAGFAIPANLGAQEMGYVAGAVMVGVPTEVGLTLALIKRARDILIGVPVLLGWQWQLAFARASG